MRIAVTIDGDTSHVDLNLDDLTLREVVAVKRLLGQDAFDATLGAGKVSDPEALQALLCVKLRDRHPDLQPDDFDLSLSELFQQVEVDPTTGS